MASKTKKYTEYSKKSTKVEEPVVNEPAEAVEEPVAKEKPVAKKYEPEKYRVTCQLLNFRSMPKVEDNIMLQLPTGEILIHDERTASKAPKDWIAVEYEKGAFKVGGYVMRKFIERV